MTTKQLYYVLVASTVVLCLAFIGVAYGANSLLGSQATNLSKLKADSQSLSSLQTSLAKNKTDITKFGPLNQIAETVVPQDKDQAEAVREIVNLAAQSGLSQLTSITFPASTLGATTTGTAGNPNLTQLMPVPGITGVYQLPITVMQATDNRVAYNRFITFLSLLEHNRRTSQVSSISVQPNSSDPSQIAFTLTISEYIKP